MTQPDRQAMAPGKRNTPPIWSPCSWVIRIPLRSTDHAGDARDALNVSAMPETAIDHQAGCAAFTSIALPALPLLSDA